MRAFIILAAILQLSIYQCFATNPYITTPDSTSVENTIMEDELIRHIDSMCCQLYNSKISFVDDTTRVSYFDYEEGYIPQWEDSIYRLRFAELDDASPISLEYNEVVRKYIDRYTQRGRQYSEKLIGLSATYFPFIEDCLLKYDMPLELKYLCVVESGLNPSATSRAGARGLWQFMPSTGKLYGLKITSYVDERVDVIKSTEAACKHLKSLYNIYDDWLLALAAYNSGTGNVNKAIKRAGNKTNYWQIYQYLPKETRGYVPAFAAVNYVMCYHEEHNLIPMRPLFTDYETDTIVVDYVVSFEQISDASGTSTDDIKYLNPQYYKDIVPGTKKNPCTITLPSYDVLTFIENPDKAFEDKPRINLSEDPSSGIHIQYYTVKNGDCLSTIAKKHHTTVKKLMKSNNLKSTNIRVGQKLKITPY